MKYKPKKLKKYELGVQKMEVPPVESPAETFQNTSKDTAKGMSIGASVGGPWGALVGGIIGTGKGIVKGAVRRHDQKIASQNASAYNNYIDKYGSTVDDPNLQFYQAKNGIDLTKYRKGSIYIKPENKGKFTASANAAGESVQEHAHNVVNDSNASTLQKKRAQFAINANKWNHSKAENGKDFTGDKDKTVEGKTTTKSMVTGETQEIGYKIQKKKLKNYVPAPHYQPNIYGQNSGQLSKYNKGTKQIEAEEDELILSKNGGSYNLKADLKGQPSHEEGGVVVNAQEGDVIFPGKKRDKILSAYKRGDYKTIDQERSKLPKDSSKAARGTYLPPGGSKINWQDESFNTIPGDTINDTEATSSNTTTGGNFNWYQFAQQAPSEYNMWKGLADKPVKTTRRYFKPDKLSYTDTTQPLLNQSNSIYQTQKQNAANTLGNRGQQLNALNQIAADKFNRDSNVIGQGVAQKANIANMNTEAMNNAKMTNLNLANQYDIYDLQNKAKQTEYLGKGLEGISANAYNRELTDNLKDRDATLMNTLTTNDYEVLPNGKIRYIRKAKRGLDMTKKKGC